MKRTFSRLVIAAVCVGCGIATNPAPPTTPPAARATLTDTARHFHLDYPPSWKATTDVTTVTHYSVVFAAINSAGLDGFIVHELRTGPDTVELNPGIIAREVPAGTAYLDISWAEGPGPVPISLADEMNGSDLAVPLKSAVETQSGELIVRRIAFQKWQKHWTITVYLHTPVTESLRRDVDKILASFRFDPARG